MSGLRLAELVPRLLPRCIADAIGRWLSGVPDRAGRIVNPGKYASIPDERPEITPLPDSPTRVLFGAMNTAGQAYRWAEAVSRLPGVIAQNLAKIDDGFGFSAHLTVPRALADASRDWQREHFRIRGASATHVIIESGLPIFGPAFRWSLVREVRALQQRGIAVAVVCHGSDVRDFEALNRRNPHSPYRLPQYAKLLPAMQHRSRATRRAIAHAGVPVFASTPGVTIDVPQAVWVPVVVDPTPWAVTTAPFSHGGVPIVVHAPSQAGIKGSEVVDEVVGRLEAEGLVRYVRLNGVAHGEVQKTYRSADIMIDSLRTGGYGVAACEAMAAGRVVVSNADDFVRAMVRESSGLEVPIVQANPDTLEQVLRELLVGTAAAQAVAARGPGFVEVVHDGRRSAQVMRPFLEGAPSRPSPASRR